MIDQDPAHHLRRDTEEMCSILPVTFPLIGKPHVRLVNQGGWLQGVVGPLVAKLSRRNASELGIDKRQQLVERAPIAATPIAEQRRHIARREHEVFNQLDRGVPA